MSDIIISEVASPRISNYVNDETELKVLFLYKRVVAELIASGKVNGYSNNDILESIRRNIPENGSLSALLFIGNIIYAVRTTLAAEILKGAFKQKTENQLTGSLNYGDDDSITIDSLLYHYKAGNKTYEA